MNDPLLITADYVAPMAEGLPRILQNAGVLIINEKILGVGERADLQRQFGDLPPNREHFHGLMLPGLINAHTHLELTGFAGKLTDHRNFPDWVAHMMQSLPREPAELDAFVRE